MITVSIFNKQVIDNLSDGITIQDRNFKIIYQNKFMLKNFGAHKGEYCYQVYEKRNKTCEGCGIKKAFLTGDIHTTLRVAKGIDNVSSYWENSCFPLFDENNNIIAGVEVCRNITDRVSLEEEVKGRNFELSQINNQLSEKTTQLQMSLNEKKLIEAKLRKEIEVRLNTEKELQRSHTKLRKTLEKLKQTQVKMLQSEKMASIGHLAAGVAHEINNPTGFVSSNLTTLGKYSEDISHVIKEYRSFANSLKNSGQGSEQSLSKRINEIESLELTIDLNYILNDIEDLISESKEGVERIKKIVGDLKDFAHPGKIDPDYSDINNNIDSTINVIWNEIKYKATVSKEYSKIPKILCYPQKLNQVFMNILINAAQAIEGNGEIKITTKANDNNIIIIIGDTGCGIPKENLLKIFDPFYTTKEVGQGTGLGLNIAYNIIKEHNGSISVDSKLGKGTKFIITLPLKGIEDRSENNAIPIGQIN